MTAELRETALFYYVLNHKHLGGMKNNLSVGMPSNSYVVKQYFPTCEEHFYFHLQGYFSIPEFQIRLFFEFSVGQDALTAYFCH